MPYLAIVLPADPTRQAASYGDSSRPLAPELVQSPTAFLAHSMKSVGNADPLQ